MINLYKYSIKSHKYQEKLHMHEDNYKFGNEAVMHQLQISNFKRNTLNNCVSMKIKKNNNSDLFWQEKN